MKLLHKLSMVIIIAGTLATTAIAMQYDKENYQIQVIKNCQLVSEFTMNESQITAYLKLKDAEHVMQSLEAPINDIEDELQSYTQQIEELTALAIQETDEHLAIDKTMLSKQEKVVRQLDILMTNHQKDFDALGEQGKIIGEIADAFTSSLAPSLKGIDHDQIQIKAPGKHINDHCSKSGFHI